MRSYMDFGIETIGYDFYCDIAINIVDGRKKLGMTIQELSDKTQIKLSRLRKIENVQSRIHLNEIKLLSTALEVTVNNLINATLDSQIGKCLYTVHLESNKDFKLYSEATSKRMAFLELEEKLNKQGVTWFSTPRTRVIVELVGVPITKQQLCDKLPKFKEEQEVEK